MRYLFEEYTFDTRLRELRRGTEAVSVTPQVFDLLDYLIRNRERLVSKDDLIDAVWNGRAVSDAALTTRINAARSAIGDTGEKQRLIKTWPRKGFRFVGAVQEDDGRTAISAASAAQGTAVTPIHTRLSIVVLPFANIGGDPEHEHFVDGVTESLTTDLSRINGAFVIARNTAFTFKGKAVDIKKLGRELGVRYVLEGSVQRSGNRLRVNVQLVDAEAGNHLWAERFDKPVADLFDMQDEIVARLANSLDAELVTAEARRAVHSPRPDAMDLVFQGRSWSNKGQTPEFMTRARGFFENAMALDPENIEAMTGLARVEAQLGSAFMADDFSARLAVAETTIVKALSLAPNYAAAHVVFGRVLIFTKRAIQGIAECEQALALDRNLAEAHGLIGMAKYFLGRGAETEIHCREALRLSPRDVTAYRWFLVIGLAKRQLNDDAEAAVWLRRSLDVNRNYSIGHFNLAASLARLGELDEARAEVQAGLALDPRFTIRRFRDAATSDNAIFLAGQGRAIDGMRMAGVPEG
ncbi:winged helix-turn-helix domain-containing protein [Bradyrhizobium diazoefficiens]|nr:winged helix-turn-helix domain-containing tetratricopeptide repeat protein [Bradyrhizobium diazoefficiens]MBR0774816.1 winged helix-turn-helix domain-containing protein [Bradyrhizobium diazoefficiens]